MSVQMWIFYWDFCVDFLQKAEEIYYAEFNSCILSVIQNWNTNNILILTFKFKQHPKKNYLFSNYRHSFNILLGEKITEK